LEHPENLNAPSAATLKVFLISAILFSLEKELVFKDLYYSAIIKKIILFISWTFWMNEIQENFLPRRIAK